MNIDQAISTARAELGLSPVMDSVERDLTLRAAAKVMADFHREFEPQSERYEVIFNGRIAEIPKGVEVTALIVDGQDITNHRARPEFIPTL